MPDERLNRHNNGVICPCPFAVLLSVSLMTYCSHNPSLHVSHVSTCII